MCVRVRPQACEKLFEKIDANDNEDLTYKVETSMMEIYMEKVAPALPPCVADIRTLLRIAAVTACGSPRSAASTRSVVVVVVVVVVPPSFANALVLTAVFAAPSRVLSQVRDLFNVDNATPLKVRDHPKRGTYVEGLTTSAVSSYVDVKRVRATARFVVGAPQAASPRRS